MTGSGIGSLIVAIFSLMQAADSHFDPTRYVLCIAGITMCSTVAWALIMAHGWGRQPQPLPTTAPAASASHHPHKQRAGAPSASAPCAAAAVPSEGSPLVGERHFNRSVLLDGEVLFCLLSGTLINSTTWGLTFLQFATAKAACNCDTRDRGAQQTFSVASSLASAAMPIGGLLSYWLPSYDTRVHVVLVPSTRRASLSRWAPSSASML